MIGPLDMASSAQVLLQKCRSPCLGIARHIRHTVSPSLFSCMRQRIFTSGTEKRTSCVLVSNTCWLCHFHPAAGRAEGILRFCIDLLKRSDQTHRCGCDKCAFLLLDFVPLLLEVCWLLARLVLKSAAQDLEQKDSACAPSKYFGRI